MQLERTPAPLENSIPDWMLTPLWEELRSWYDICDARSMHTAFQCCCRLSELRETAERVRSFLLERNRKPPLRYFLEDFLDWRMRNPVKVKVNYPLYLRRQQDVDDPPPSAVKQCEA